MDCSCCGTAIEWNDRIDFGWDLPDALLGLPEGAVHRDSRGLVKADDVGHFLRCLLSVMLSGDVTLVLGVWIQVTEQQYKRCLLAWESPEYADLAVNGTLATKVSPWAAAYGDEVKTRVYDVEQLPVIVAADDCLTSRMLSDVWDRDEVLSEFSCKLPIAVREGFSNGWTIERSPQMRSSVKDYTVWFTGDDREVSVEILHDRTQGDLEEALSNLLTHAPETPIDQQVRYREGPELRNAFWRTVQLSDGTPEYQFYGQVLRDCAALWMVCTHTRPDDHEWAMHVFRSIATN